MALMDKFKAPVNFAPCVNTGTLYDLATGRYQPGVDGKWYLNGGLHLVNGFMGKGNTYKSGTSGSLMARSMSIFDDCDAFVYESEHNIPDENRYDDFVPSFCKPVSDRIVFHNTNTMYLDDWFSTVQTMVEDKMKNKKEYFVDSPFLDPKTMKPAKMWKPTFVAVDSFSKARSKAGIEKCEDNNIDSSELNTMYMADGMLKTRIMEMLAPMAAKAGIYFILTAHVSDTNINMNARIPVAKELQYMKQADKIKNVGSKFTFLTTTLIQMLGATVLEDSAKTGTYYPHPDGRSPKAEVNEVNAMVVRCKNNAAGSPIPFVISQYQGILNEVTNFHYLKKFKEFGMTSSGRNNYTLDLYPEKHFHRTNIRKVMDDSYEMRRALELTTQLCFIQNNWFLPKLPQYLQMDIREFAERLMKNTKPTISDVLNSRGYWTTSKCDRPYMSIMDIAQLVAEVKK